MIGLHAHFTRRPAVAFPAILALLLLIASQSLAGRWVTHITTCDPDQRCIGEPVDMIALPETANHWCWLVWYDMTAGTWESDIAMPYDYSDGYVEWRVPQFNRWYYLMIYDTATGIWY